MSLYCPVGAKPLANDAFGSELLAAEAVGPRHAVSHALHTPLYREAGVHMKCMYWLLRHPVPLGSVHGTHCDVSDSPLPVHWFTST